MEEEKRIASLNYEELDKDLELEIFGLKFGIGLNESYLKDLSKIKYEDDNSIKDVIDALLGNGSYEKIKDKFRKDRGKEIDEFVWVKVVLFIKQEFEKYMNSYQDKFKENNFPINREQRRSNRYSRNFNRRYASEYNIFRSIFYLCFLYGVVIPFFTIFYNYKITGVENLPKWNKRDKYIFTANHVSIFDPFLVPMAVKKIIAFMAKKELFDDQVPSVSVGQVPYLSPYHSSNSSAFVETIPR